MDLFIPSAASDTGLGNSMNSLRNQLLILISFASLLLWSIVAWVCYVKVQHEVDELLDAQLQQSADLVYSIFSHIEKTSGTGSVEIRIGASGVTNLNEQTKNGRGEIFGDLSYRPELAFIVSRQGKILLRSDNAPDFVLNAAPGIANLGGALQDWRVHSRDFSNNLRIQIGHIRMVREKVALEVAERIALPVLLSIPILFILVYLAVRRGLSSLNSLTENIATVTIDKLEPIPAEHTPSEVRPLFVAINKLLARLEMAVKQERRFTAEAAHELRTPIAALKIHAQVANTTPSDSDRRHSIFQILLGIRRTERLIEQMLKLARLDPFERVENPLTIEINTLFSSITDATEIIVESTQHKFVTRFTEPGISVQGDYDLLHLSLVNLVSNSCTHTAAGCRIELAVEEIAGSIAIVVQDDGAGVADTEIAELGTRFFKSKYGKNQGNGLGLAIVKRIAEMQGIEVHISNRPSGGLRVALVWPNYDKGA